MSWLIVYLIFHVICVVWLLIWDNGTSTRSDRAAVEVAVVLLIVIGGPWVLVAMAIGKLLEKQR